MLVVNTILFGRTWGTFRSEKYFFVTFVCGNYNKSLSNYKITRFSVFCKEWVGIDLMLLKFAEDLTEVREVYQYQSIEIEESKKRISTNEICKSLKRRLFKMIWENL